MKAFFDHNYIMNSVYNKVTDAIRSMFPFEGNTHKLVLNNLWVDDKLSTNDIQQQLDAKLRRKSWEVPVYADVSLIDKRTGKTLDRAAKIRILSIPKITHRYSYIVDGTEYQVPSQMRLKPGIYVHQKADGPYRGWFNLAKGFNKEFSVNLDPKDRRFLLAYGGSRTIPLYSVLRGLGYSEEDIEKSWGKDLLAINRQPTIKLGMSKFYRALFNHEPESEDKMVPDIINKFKSGEMDPEVNKITLKKDYAYITPGAIFDAADKVLKVARGKEQEDDRESLIFKNIMTIDDFLGKRLPDSIRNITRQIKNNIDRKSQVKDILTYNVFNVPVKAFFKSSNLSNSAEHTSPLGFLTEQTKITPLGEGAIGGLYQITDAERGINPSHIGFIDPVHTPDNDRAGVVLHMGLLASKEGTDLEIKVIDAKTGFAVPMTPLKLMNAVVAFNSQYTFEKGKSPTPRSKMVDAVVKGEIKKVNAKDVRFIFVRDASLFSLGSNLTPFLQSTQGNRALLATKMIPAAIALKDPEAPLVMPTFSRASNTPVEKFVGSLINQAAPVSGEVTSVTDSVIIIKDKDGVAHKTSFYKNYPIGGNSFIDSTPRVKVGDKVGKGDIIATTNYSDKDGNYAYGKNLEVAYMAFKGLNTDDGIVISETAAKKLTSEHLYKKKLTVDANILLSKSKFRALYPTAVTEKQAGNLDEDGIVKKGVVLKPGDPVMLILRKEPLTMEDLALKKLYKRIAIPYKNRSIIWEEDHEGTVVNVEKHGKYVDVYIKTEEPAVIGDKLCNREANKGVIVHILPDGQMPKTKSGKPVEILMSPAGITTRMNSGQILETVASKIAEKSGHPYLTENFPSRGNELDHIKAELKRYGITDTEKLFDPETDKELGDIMAGKQYIVKLKQQVIDKIAARSGGGSEPYTSNRMAKGGGFSAGQAMGHLGVYAMLAHGAPHNLQEMTTYKVDMNPDYWDALQRGETLPPAKPPFAYNKFMGYLKAMGINVEHRNNQLITSPLTDKEALKLSNGAIDPTKVIRGKDLQPEKGGLFDEKLTGGGSGNLWTHIELAEAVPNPLFEEAINSLLRLEKGQYEKIINGELGVTKGGVLAKDGDYKRGDAFKELLKNINVSTEIVKAENSVKDAPPSKIAKEKKRLKILRALNSSGISPQEAYLRKVLPVTPPVFRPITPLDSGAITSDDMNGLYKNIGMLNYALKDAKGFLTTKEINEGYANLYDAVKAMELDGVKIGTKQHKSVMDLVRGEGSPKEGFFQKQLIRRRKQDLSGRSVVTPNPNLKLDQAGIPYIMAWKVYEPFIVRRLVAQGKSPNEAVQLIEQQDPLAKRALEIEVTERPAMIKRDPVLHKYGVQAFNPVLVEGYSIQLHPLNTKGFGADFDGDTVSVYVPISPQAVKETHRMFPSNNLFSTTNGKLVTYPHQETQLGLYLLTKEGKKTNKKYKTEDEALSALTRDEITPTDVITVGSSKTTAGRIKVNKFLPDKHKISTALDSKTTMKLLTQLAKEDPKGYPKVLDGMKDLGYDWSYRSGFSLSLKDFDPVAEKQVSDVWDKAEKEVFGKDMTDAETIAIFTRAKEEADKLLVSELKTSDNSMYTMAISGSKGSMGQISQIIGSVGLVQNLFDQTVPYPIKGNLSKGLNIAEYWAHTHGARKGTIAAKNEVKDPGLRSKLLMNSMLDQVITEEDCGTRRGISLEITSKEALDRITSQPIKLKDGEIVSSGTITTPELFKKLEKHGIRSIVVRSPLRCESRQGVCQKCMGLNEVGEFQDIGTAVGVMATQAIGEPSTQLALSNWHKGGVVERGISPTARLGQLLEFPKNLRNKATLSQFYGKVEFIRPSPVGGYDVTIKGVEHWVPREVSVIVKRGESVKRGQAISSGVIDPRELMELRGVEAAQNYITDELYDVLESQGPVKRKNLELVVRSLAGAVEITDHGTHPDYLPGDIVPVSKINYYNKSGRFMSLAPEKTVGMKLSSPIKGLAAGTEITEEMLDKIEFPSEIEVEAPPIKYSPVVRGINVLPLEAVEDWIAKLNFRDLKGTIIDSAMYGGVSNLHGLNPIPSLVRGVDVVDAHNKTMRGYET